MTRFGAVVTSGDVTVPYLGDVAGPPTSGTWAVQDMWTDTAGEIWVCVAAGTPGTWTNPSAGKELGYAEVASGSQDVTSTTSTDITGLSITFDPLGRAYWLEVFANVIAQAGAPVNGGIVITDGAATTTYTVGLISVTTAATGLPLTVRKRFAGSSGSITRKARAFVASGDTIRFTADPLGLGFILPYYIRAYTA